MTLAVSVVIVAALYLAREVLIPITLAVLLSFLLAPLSSLFRRLHLGRIPSVLLSVLIAVGIIVGLGGVVGVQIAGVVGDIPRYQTTIRQKADTLRGLTTERLSGLIGQVSREVGSATKSVPGG